MGPTLQRVHADPSELPPELPQAGVTVLEVTVAGMINGERWQVGDRVVCWSGVRDGLAVLAPRGHGRPIVGRVDGRRLTGVWGEPCHPDRWQVVGGVVARVSRPQRQLPLFAVAA